MTKEFKLRADQIVQMIPDIGGAIATDKITVEGKKVDYMVHEKPSREEDSGWIFYGGGETQEYLDNPSNSSVFSVNTICNYDPEIISFLTYPPGTEIERNVSGELELITKNVKKPSIRFMYPVDKGTVDITKHWSFDVSSWMLRRLDDSSLVIWRPGFTIWLNAYTSESDDIGHRIDGIQNTASTDSFGQERVEQNDGLSKFRYFLVEREEDSEQASAYIFGFAKTHEIHITLYYDDESFIGDIDLVWRTLKYRAPQRSVGLPLPAADPGRSGFIH